MTGHRTYPPARRAKTRLHPGSVLVGALAGLLLSALLLAVRPLPTDVPEEPWPSYRAAFAAVAPVVVNVAVESPEARVGSGFAVAPDQVVTARHLVIDADEVVIRDILGRELTARLVGADARTDLALLEVDGGGLVPAVLGDASELQVGDTVLAIGNPYGLGHSLAVGVIGQRGRRLGSEVDGPRVDFLQLSMPLNPGNSGGPLFDRTGRVVGVLSGTHAQGQAIAFAVPVEALVEELDELRRGERVSRAFLGVGVAQRGEGLRVVSVIPSSPADRAGIRPGDELSAVAGDLLRTPADLDRALDRLGGGNRASVRLMRDGQLHLVDVVLADWAEQPVAVGGMTLRPTPGAGGEVVALRPRSRAEGAGVQVGDVIRSVDGVPVRAPADIKDALAGGEPAQLELLRGGVPVVVQL